MQEEPVQNVSAGHLHVLVFGSTVLPPVQNSQTFVSGLYTLSVEQATHYCPLKNGVELGQSTHFF